ncbi:MAG: plastocyanin/azurin family copper-binding protein [Gemmatimonadales bacterium]
MPSFLRTSIYSLALLISSTHIAAGQRVHQIKLDANPEKEIYRFSPAQISARPGDVLLFRVASGAPHSVVFEGAGLTETAREALNGSMNRRAGDLSSPLLTSEGMEYRIVVPQIPPGSYGFFCLPHRAYDMRGELRITK